MSKKTLDQLYAEHAGKVSDKWSMYLVEYDRIFSEYRHKPIHILEIGIQNGGSLEIWSKYFDKATRIVGCDIDPGCASLKYDNPRIAIVIGDANTDSTQNDIIELSPEFDIVIDDGSHTSGDIVKSFSRYFAMIKNGGVFVVEDLHASYWQELEGGLFYPFSSITFLKRLADVINHEHWGLQRKRTGIFKGFFDKYEFEVEEDLLKQVHSVEFINSMCVIRKMPAQSNLLGERIFFGEFEEVVPGIRDREIKVPPQTDNLWSTSQTPPSEELPLRLQELVERDEQIITLEQNVEERGSQIVSLNEAMETRDSQIVGLNEAMEENHRKIAGLKKKTAEHDTKMCNLNQLVSEQEGQVNQLREAVQVYQNSTSWWLTKPLRFIGRKAKRLKNAFVLLGVLLLNVKHLGYVVRKVRGTNLDRIEGELELLQSEKYVAQVSRERGLSIALLRVLTPLGNRFFRFKHWWGSNSSRSKYTTSLGSFLRGETGLVKEFASDNIYLSIDNPRRIFKIVRGAFTISGWCVDLDKCDVNKVRVRIGKTIYNPHLKQREDVQKIFATKCQLPIDLGFCVIPNLSMGLHRMRIDVIGPDGTWVLAHRALVLQISGNALWKLKWHPYYKTWYRAAEKQLKVELPDLKRHMDVMIHKPVFTIVIDTRQSLDGWKKTLQSIQQQIYPHHELYVLKNAGATLPRPLEKAATCLEDLNLTDIGGDFIIFIDGGQSLSSEALYEFANAINQHPDLDLVYGDEDRLKANGDRIDPFYKPDWSPDYLETFNYIGFPACFRKSIVRKCDDYNSLYDLVLRFTEQTKNIMHVVKVLGHKRQRKIDDKTLRRIAAKDIAAIQGRIKRTGRQATVREHELHRGCYDIELQLKDQPLISVIIPTAGKTVTVGERQIDLIINVIDQIRNQSSYKNIEIIVIDNDDLTIEQKRSIAEYDCKRLTFTEPVFNIPKKLNLGASIAKGELMLLMNDDIEIISASWIERLMEHFEKPHVGVVGAKLLYPDGQTQHVGVVHNSGNPDHVRRLFPGDESGYYFSTCGVRNYMAVTGAVMMTRTSLYRQIGGYSEELAVSYNDADYCLKAQEKGFQIVYAPKAALIHMESQSRVALADMDEVNWYQDRWATRVISDPYYNEEFLTVASPTFVPMVNERLL